MGGSTPAGGRGKQTEQGAGGGPPEKDPSAPAEGAPEATGTKRGGNRRTPTAKKSAAKKSTTPADRGTRTDNQERKRSRGGGSAAGRAKAKEAGTGKPGTPTVEVARRLPVREDEEQWSRAELEELRAGLEKESASLRAEIERSESEIAERLDDPSEGAGDDQADVGAKTFEREHEMSLANNARDLLTQNERAVGRIEGGTYGVCEGCGNPIGKARLQAFPRAALCMACKQREERR